MGETMTYDFLPKDPEKQLAELKEVLYDRLKDVKRYASANVDFPLNDDFELGINCRLANEAVWLHWLLDKIERS